VCHARPSIELYSARRFASGPALSPEHIRARQPDGAPASAHGNRSRRKPHTYRAIGARVCPEHVSEPRSPDPLATMDTSMVPGVDTRDTSSGHTSPGQFDGLVLHGNAGHDLARGHPQDRGKISLPSTEGE
jgi:hypothetical protein